MKKLLAFLTSLVLCGVIIIVIHNVIIKRDFIQSQGFKTWSNMYKDLSYDAINDSIGKNTVLLFGSSELNHERRSPYHPCRFFPNSKHDVMLIGGAFNQSLYHTIALGAFEKKLENKKVVLILSPTWFYKKGISDSRFSLRFSESQYGAFIKNKDVPKDVKEYVARRSEALLKGNSSMQSIVKMYNDNYLRGEGNLFEKLYIKGRKIYNSDREILAINTSFKENGIKSSPVDKRIREMKRLNFNDMLLEASNEEDKHNRDNQFFMREKGFNKLNGRLSGKYKNSHINDDFSSSPEYDDLEAFLKICKANDIKVMLVLLPVNGYWYDYTGMKEKARESFRTNSIALANKYNAEVADFFGHQYDKQFLIDEVHPTGKGWLMINEKIYQFYEE